VLLYQIAWKLGVLRVIYCTNAMMGYVSASDAIMRSC